MKGTLVSCQFSLGRKKGRVGQGLVSISLILIWGAESRVFSCSSCSVGEGVSRESRWDCQGHTGLCPSAQWAGG